MSTIEISTDPTRMDITVIHRFLSEQTHWARGIARPVLERALANSICFGAFDGPRQVGFARVVSDRATFAFLADVFILPEWRGRGLVIRLLDAVFAHADLQWLRRFALTSRDAGGLYHRYGFTPVTSPLIWRERHNPHVYAPPAPEDKP